MDYTIPIEQRLIEAIRILTPDKQQAVIDFAEFLQDRQSMNGISDVNAIPAPFFGEEDNIANGSIDLEERGMSTGEAAELRYRLRAFTEDWERPEVAIYDEI